MKLKKGHLALKTKSIQYLMMCNVPSTTDQEIEQFYNDLKTVQTDRTVVHVVRSTT